MKDKNKLLSKSKQFNSKNKARIHFKKIRKSSLLNTEEAILERVIEHIKSIDREEDIEKAIGIYWPLQGEVDLRNLKESLSYSFALPACNTKGEISYHRWTNDTLEKDIYGIPAPLSQPPLKAEEISLLIVPALAIDHMGTRLGYGSGCFDRLREKPRWKEIEALAVVPSQCISRFLLPKDSWDVPFHGWINEKEIFQIKDFDNQ